METDRGTQTPAAQSQPDAESQPGPPPTMERECLHASDAPQKNKKNCVCDRPNVAAALLRISAEFESLKRRVEHLERGLVATE